MTVKNSETACKHFIGRRGWRLLGGVALALLATGLITQLSDIRRYLKITTM